MSADMVSEMIDDARCIDREDARLEVLRVLLFALGCEAVERPGMNSEAVKIVAIQWVEHLQREARLQGVRRAAALIERWRKK